MPSLPLLSLRAHFTSEETRAQRISLTLTCPEPHSLKTADFFKRESANSKTCLPFLMLGPLMSRLEAGWHYEIMRSREKVNHPVLHHYLGGSASLAEKGSCARPTPASLETKDLRARIICSNLTPSNKSSQKQLT